MNDHYREAPARTGRYNGLDLVKFIMAFFVIAIHTHPLKNCQDERILTFFSNLFNLAVPWFFLTSGFLLALKLSPSDTSQNIRVIRSKLKKTVILYLTWMLIYTPMAVYRFVSRKTPFSRSVLLYLRGLFFTGEQYNSWPLWYLLSTIYALVWILFLIRLTDRSGHLPSFLSGGIFKKGFLPCAAFLLSFLSCGITLLIGYSGSLPFLLSAVRKLLTLSFRSSRILTGAIYIPLGMSLARKKMPLSLNCFLFAAGFLLYYFYHGKLTGFYPLMASTVGLFGMTASWHLKDRPVYPVLRRMSMIMYLIHMYVWAAWYTLVWHKKTDGPVSFLVTAAVSCLIAYLWQKHLRRKDAK